MNKKLALTAALLAVFSAVPFLASGAEASPAAPAEEQRRPSRGGMFADRERMAAQLKEKFPAEYAEIEKLRETDRRAAMMKTMELARKAGIEMPRPGGFRGGMPMQQNSQETWQNLFTKLKEKDPAGVAEVEKLLASDPAKAMEKLKEIAAKAGLQVPEGLPTPGDIRPESPRNRNRFMVERATRILKHTQPEKMAEVAKLQKTDPDAARELFRTLVKDAGLTTDELAAQDSRRRRVASFVFSDKELEAQYEQAAGSVQNQRPPWGGGRGMMPPWGGGRGMGGMGGWRR